MSTVASKESSSTSKESSATENRHTSVERQSGQRYRRKHTTLGFHHRKNDSIASTASGSSTSDHTDSAIGGVNSSPGSNGETGAALEEKSSRLTAIAATGMSSASSTSSIPSMDQSFASSSNVTTSKSEPTPLTSGGPQKGATPSSVKSLGNDKVSSTPSGGGATSK